MPGFGAVRGSTPRSSTSGTGCCPSQPSAISRPRRIATTPGTGSGTARCDPSAGNAVTALCESHNPTATCPASRTSISVYVLLQALLVDASAIASKGAWRRGARKCDLPGAAYHQLVAGDVDGHGPRLKPPRSDG